MERIKPPSAEESSRTWSIPRTWQGVFAYLEKEKRWRDCSLIAILYDTGLRATELADLLTANVNLDTGFINSSPPLGS